MFFSKINLDKPYKITLLGDGSTGKTSFFNRFTQIENDNYKFNKNYIATKDYNLKTMNFNTNYGVFNIHLWDTAGQEYSNNLRDAYLLNSDGVIALYDISNKRTLDNVPNWLLNVNRLCGKIPVAIVGNKLDKKYNLKILSKKDEFKLELINLLKIIKLSVEISI
jgi:small GTP-binding protein